MLPAEREFRSESLPVAFGLQPGRMDLSLESCQISAMRMGLLLVLAVVGVAAVAAVRTREWRVEPEWLVAESSTMTGYHSWA